VGIRRVQVDWSGTRTSGCLCSVSMVESLTDVELEAPT